MYRLKITNCYLGLLRDRRKLVAYLSLDSLWNKEMLLACLSFRGGAAPRNPPPERPGTDSLCLSYCALRAQVSNLSPARGTGQASPRSW